MGAGSGRLPVESSAGHWVSAGASPGRLGITLAAQAGSPLPCSPAGRTQNRAPCHCITYTGINKDLFYLNKYQVYGLYNIHIMPLSPGSGLAAGEDSHVVLFRVVRLRGEFGRSWKGSGRGGEAVRGVRGAAGRWGSEPARPTARPRDVPLTRAAPVVAHADGAAAVAGGPPEVARRGVGDVVVAAESVVQAGGLGAGSRPAHHAVGAARLVHHAGVGAGAHHAGAGLCREAQAAAAEPPWLG